jgi:hypothetical protein
VARSVRCGSRSAVAAAAAFGRSLQSALILRRVAGRWLRIRTSGIAPWRLLAIGLMVIGSVVRAVRRATAGGHRALAGHPRAAVRWVEDLPVLGPRQNQRARTDALPRRLQRAGERFVEHGRLALGRPAATSTVAADAGRVLRQKGNPCCRKEVAEALLLETARAAT